MCINTKQQKEELREVSKCLQYLEDAGWTELIDSRYENQVTDELMKQFPNISDDVLVRVLNLVLV